MNDFTLFLRKFLTQGTAIASLAPSSRWLARATVASIDWSRDRVILELGAGTGPITRELAARARPESRVLVVERDPDFATILRHRFGNQPNIEIIEGDVRTLPELLDQRGVRRVDQIISGLPVPSFPRSLQVALFAAVKSILSAEGTFSQITEMPWVYWRFYRRYFGSVQFRFEPRNFPPAGVYSCRGVK